MITAKRLRKDKRQGLGNVDEKKCKLFRKGRGKSDSNQIKTQ